MALSNQAFLKNLLPSDNWKTFITEVANIAIGVLPAGSVSATELATTLDLTGKTITFDTTTVGTDKKVQFRDTGIYLNSSVDGQLDVVADAEIQIASPIVDINASTGLALDGANLNSAWTVNAANKIQFRDTGLYLNSSADGTLDIVADTILAITAPSLTLSGDTTVATAQKIQFRDTGLYINSSADGTLDIVADTILAIAAPSVTITGASTLTGALTIGVDGTGHDVTLYGATAGSYLLWDESADKLKVVGVLDIEDTSVGGAANGSVIKKQLQAGEAYTATTAGLMVKNYGEATATVPSGEFTGLYVSLKGLHTDPGNNTSLISAHVHASNTTVVHAGLWIYGDVTNGVKASGSTLTTMIDTSEATSVTNFASFVAATDKACETNTGTPSGAVAQIIRVDIAGTPGYIPVYASKPT